MITISVTEAMLFTQFKAFLATVLAGTYEIGQGQQNLIASPNGPYVRMTTLYTRGLSTDRKVYDVPNSAANHQRSTEWVCQLDVYGDTAADDANTIAQLIRTDYCCDYFATNGDILAPLYATDARNTAMVNAEQQYENRYTLEFHAQYNPVTTVPQQFANTLQIVLVEADATP